MDDLINDTKEAIKKRLGSPLYANFFISWLGYNWETVYVTLFIDQNILLDSKQITKIEYIQSLYGTGNFLEWFCTIAKLFIFPAISVWAILWGLNKLDLKIYKKDLANKKRKQIAKIESEKEELKAEKEKFEAEEETNKAKKAAKAELTEEEIWETEEAKMAENHENYVKIMNELKDFIYIHHYSVYGDQQIGYQEYERNISIDTLAFLEINLIIEKFNNEYTITKKGKFFLKQFINRESQKEDM